MTGPLETILPTAWLEGGADLQGLPDLPQDVEVQVEDLNTR